MERNAHLNYPLHRWGDGEATASTAAAKVDRQHARPEPVAGRLVAVLPGMEEEPVAAWLLAASPLFRLLLAENEPSACQTSRHSNEALLEESCYL